MPGLTALMIAAAASAQTTAPPRPAGPRSPAPPDAEIRRIIAERVDAHRQSLGIVVGVIEPSGRRIVAYGRRAADGSPVDADTVFEIGSITKVFTALLLADAVQRGEVALTDPVSKYLPPSVKMPERRGRPITLQDLATHTSGLPRLPDNMPIKDPANPYADYTVDHLYQFLSKHELTREAGPDTQPDYSNLGMGLLGHVLALRAGVDYETLVRTRITGPLGMRDTSIALSPGMQARLASGHSPALQAVPLWDLPTLAGAGALRSTANDMLTFLEAALGYRTSPLSQAFPATIAPRRAAGPVADVGLAWQILKDRGTEIVWHNGGTGGYRTWVGYETGSRTGVVVLTNVSSPAGPDDIGRHLLNPKFPLVQTFPPPPRQRTQTTVAPEVFDRYVGRYQLAPALLLTVTRDGGRFFVQLTGQQPLEVFAESERQFFLKVVDAQLTFESDAQGRTTAVVLRQNGIDQRAPRIEGEPVEPASIALAPAVLEGYVGRYQLAPGMVMTITRQDSRLFAQLTGQTSIEVFASAPREFFYKVVNARLVFEVDADGRATAVVLHQNGMTPRAPRIE